MITRLRCALRTAFVLPAILIFFVPSFTLVAVADNSEHAESSARQETPCPDGSDAHSKTVKAGKSNSSDWQVGQQARTTVKSSKSNSSERLASPDPVPTESSNLNLSKSNVDRSSGQTETENDEAADSDGCAAE